MTYMIQEGADKDYSRQVECQYRKYHYAVRDNGAVSRLNDGLFPADDLEWSFGNEGANGLLYYKTASVSRIVATAFHGAAPNDSYNIDYIDGNPQNNRPANLRWYSWLESLLDNPSTVEKIIKRFGTIDQFKKNPSRLAIEGDGYSRMITVSREEVEDAINNLIRYSKAAPLHTGDTFIENANSCNLRTQDDSSFPIGSVSKEDIMSVWSTLPKAFEDSPRFSRLLSQADTSISETDGVLQFAVHVANEAQAKWIEQNKLVEMERLMKVALQSDSIRIKIVYN